MGVTEVLKEIKKVLTFDLIEVVMMEKFPEEVKPIRSNMLEKADSREVKKQSDNMLENADFQLVKRKIH